MDSVDYEEYEGEGAFVVRSAFIYAECFFKTENLFLIGFLCFSADFRYILVQCGSTACGQGAGLAINRSRGSTPGPRAAFRCNPGQVVHIRPQAV